MTADNDQDDLVQRSIEAMQAHQKRTGGPAFPTHLTAQSGMSLRDWFAGMALTGLIMHDHSDEGGEVGESTAAFAYLYADQMIKAREVKSDG